MFRQVSTNLLSNAIKFSRNQEQPVIQIGSRTEKGETILFVRDNGAGFDPRFADKLFGVFQGLHRQDEFEGTGIGLATTQRIVHKHGGRIWAGIAARARRKPYSPMALGRQVREILDQIKREKAAK